MEHQTSTTSEQPYPTSEPLLPIGFKIYLFSFFYLFIYMSADWIAGGRLPTWLAWPGILAGWFSERGFSLLGFVGEGVLATFAFILSLVVNIGQYLGGYMIVYYCLLAITSAVLARNGKSSIFSLINLLVAIVLCWILVCVSGVIYSNRYVAAMEAGEGEKAARILRKIEFFSLDDMVYDRIIPEALRSEISLESEDEVTNLRRVSFANAGFSVGVPVTWPETGSLCFGCLADYDIPLPAEGQLHIGRSQDSGGRSRDDCSHALSSQRAGGWLAVNSSLFIQDGAIQGCLIDSTTMVLGGGPVRSLRRLWFLFNVDGSDYFLFISCCPEGSGTELLMAVLENQIVPSFQLIPPPR